MRRLPALPALLIAGLIASLAALWRYFPPASSGDAAAWAQAITSAAAIFAALFVVLWQHRLPIEREAGLSATKKFDRVEAAFQLAAYCSQVIEKVIQASESTQSPEMRVLEGALGELRAIGAAFEKYRAEDFATYSELKPLMTAIAVRHTAEIKVADACALGRKDLVGPELRSELPHLVTELRPQVEALRILAHTK
jgi:hypothetical protein